MGDRQEGSRLEILDANDLLLGLKGWDMHSLCLQMLQAQVVVPEH